MREKATISTRQQDLVKSVPDQRFSVLLYESSTWKVPSRVFENFEPSSKLACDVSSGYFGHNFKRRTSINVLIRRRRWGDNCIAMACNGIDYSRMAKKAQNSDEMPDFSDNYEGN